MTPHGFQIVKYSTSFRYRDRKVEITFYAKEDADVVVDTILFLGTGQVGKPGNLEKYEFLCYNQTIARNPLKNTPLINLLS